MKIGFKRKFTAFFLMIAMAFCALLPALAMAAEAKKPVIGISWESSRDGYDNLKKVIEAAGGIPVELKQVTSKDVKYKADGTVDESCLEPSGMLKQSYADKIKARTYDKTNVAEVMKGIDGVFFTGGEDISPSLFKVPQKEANKGEEINATRDISDYTLWAYCIDKNIPALGVCRGEQMLGIVSGVTFIQDIPTYYAEKGAAYHDLHRMPVGAPNRTYARHDIVITNKKSHLYELVGDTKLANVSSWHHQAIDSLIGSGLIQTAKTVDNGVSIVEGVENPSKDFIVGVQFHPENDCSLAIAEGKPDEALCDVDTCLNIIKGLVKAASK
ncbi:MAG: gamma-glutamyl-gamma-aminobutyrate hydrolase family protein [Acidaminococcus sp.]|jgi:gamma-glutamyl-gamma-aminobutyrate hydrolase PuuD|nr:gamma-glutamyl-gamma-aminobutyrate hydrolase family protein [Acidaminococcus sp.]MCI2099699.1 gamma-glutamyl-gamma-aminobutyrate hydrolase family protein [Acidaminococcus sp.]MCI2113897.1 gamma-glutamyl-gamma-aminobutyrate hydrolase family protein [Acidaminococcus sp.]MCI2115867.1 gamma-glutamyl-gamma-aminobutyrate hydrolase family protein [Acidaminococcus sp.]